MRNLTIALGLTATVALLAGCSSNNTLQSPSIPSDGGQPHSAYAPAPLGPMPESTFLPALLVGPRPPGWLAPAVQKGTTSDRMYVSEENGSEVVIYPEPPPAGSPVGMITSGVSDPWGLYCDKAGNLYVVNQSGTVTVYPSGSVYPSTTYSQDLGRPLYAIVDQYGNMFVGNGNGGYGGGTVVEYLAGSTSAYQVLQTPGTEVDGMDFDLKGNLYVSYRGADSQQPGLGSIEEFPSGSTQGKLLGMNIFQPQSIIVDNKGNIVVTNTARGTRPIHQYVFVFAPGKKYPTLKVPFPEYSEPNQMETDKKLQHLFATSYNNGDIYKTTYPLSKSTVWTLEQEDPYGLQQGLALNNGQVF